MLGPKKPPPLPESNANSTDLTEKPAKMPAIPANTPHIRALLIPEGSQIPAFRSILR